MLAKHRTPAILLSIATTAAFSLLAGTFDRTPAFAASATAVDAGGAHTCAIAAADGTVHCWGDNSFGQLGDGTLVNRTTPVPVTGLGGGIIEISSGGFHTCARTSVGGIKCWGRNDSGQLGNSSTANSSAPVDVTGLSTGVASISAGGFHTCAVLTTGQAKCWGRNDAGQVGDGTGTNRSSPVDVSGLAGGVSRISAGGGDSFGEHTCAVTSSGGVKCWGRNDFGQLGNGSTVGSNTPVDASGLASGIVEVDAGRYHSCARTNTNGAKCWGWNIGGQLGNGTFTSSTIPVDVINLNGGASGLSTGGMHACVGTLSSGAKCWGFNNTGQLGNGMAGGNHHTPGDVVSLTNVVSVSAGGGVSSGGHTCALLADGTIRCWGENGSGQLGDGSTSQRNSPVSVTGFDQPDPTATPTNTETPTPTQTPSPTSTNVPPSATPSSTSTNTSQPPATATSDYTGTPVPRDIWEQLYDLHELVEALNLPANLENSLLKKLEDAQKDLELGRSCHAINNLNTFINKVEALGRSRRISADDATILVAETERMIEVIRPNCNQHRR